MERSKEQILNHFEKLRTIGKRLGKYHNVSWVESMNAWKGQKIINKINYVSYDHNENECARKLNQKLLDAGFEAINTIIEESEGEGHSRSRTRYFCKRNN
jgi:hypothetical protein